MKKYYFKENGKELKFGDMLEVDLSEDLPNGKTHYHHLECKFHPSLADLLLDAGIIEVKEEGSSKEKEGDMLNTILERIIGALIRAQEETLKYLEEVENRLTDLEEAVAELLPEKSDK